MSKVSISPAWSSSKEDSVPPTDKSEDDVMLTSRDDVTSRDVSRRSDFICLRGVSESRVSVIVDISGGVLKFSHYT